MAITYKVRYKNHCTPQEQILTGGRWYLDSDCGRKLTGDTATGVTMDATGNYEASKAVTTTGSACKIVATGDNYQFLFVKNTGSEDIYMSLEGDTSSKYVIRLSQGEAFACDINVGTEVFLKTASGTSTIEHYEAK